MNRRQNVSKRDYKRDKWGRVFVDLEVHYLTH